MITAKSPRVVLRDANLRPKKSFGQNFLVDARVTTRIAEACVPDEELGRASVVEVGAGTGALTAPLLARARRVTAIERDRDLLPLLRETFREATDQKRLLLVEGDAAQVDFRVALGEQSPRVLAGNLPYQISGRLLELACGAAGSLDRVIFMVQREVADRLLASPSTKEYGALTVFVRAAFEVERVFNVSAASFFPPPQVGSTVVALLPRKLRIQETAAFRALVLSSFEQRRKTLRNSWTGVATRDILEAAALAAGTTLGARGETLSAEAFSRAAEVVTAAQKDA